MRRGRPCTRAQRSKHLQRNSQSLLFSAFACWQEIYDKLSLQSRNTNRYSFLVRASVAFDSFGDSNALLTVIHLIMKMVNLQRRSLYQHQDRQKGGLVSLCSCRQLGGIYDTYNYFLVITVGARVLHTVPHHRA